MLTRLRIRNFKRFNDADIELASPVVFIGPNNSGKTTALQALALWDIGRRAWNSKRTGKDSPKSRPGVPLNRRDLISLPVPEASLLWRDLHVRDTSKSNGKSQTINVRVDVEVQGVTRGIKWTCGFEFDYSNAESFVCRPLRQPGFETSPVKDAEFTDVPPQAHEVQMAYLPPMSGLVSEEPKAELGWINVLIGQGQTAQVLRNLCHQISLQNNGSDWNQFVLSIRELFGVELQEPEFLSERGVIQMEYLEKGIRLDLSSAGRGLQQTMLLMAYMYAHPQSVLLLDEPDAHLEILRQRETFDWITRLSEQQGSQVIAASHSEVILNEAAESGSVVAFVGRPHLLVGRQSGQVRKALAEIGFQDYLIAEENGWFLYLEDTTDLLILQEFAAILQHPVREYLRRPCVRCVTTNLPQKARDHFYGLREAKADLIGIALFDRLSQELQKDRPLVETCWNRREIENYFCTEEVLLEFANDGTPDDLFGREERKDRKEAMLKSIEMVNTSRSILGHPDGWSIDTKASDDFLVPVFNNFSKLIDRPLILRKGQYYKLVRFMAPGLVDPEVIQKLDLIHKTAQNAKPQV